MEKSESLGGNFNADFVGFNADGVEINADFVEINADGVGTKTLLSQITIPLSPK